MKIGVKTFDSPEFLRHFKDKSDFFEIMAIETVNYDFLNEFDIPIVIHSQHRSFGVNVADKTKIQRNLNSINFARKIADQTKSKKIIVHPGELDSKNSSREQAIEFIRNINDKRIIIENIPLMDVYRFGAKSEEIKEILKETKKGFCFDINHAMFTAISLKQDYRELIKEFVKLKPVHYHLGGQIIKDRSLPFDKREHLALGESDFDIKEIISLLPKDAEITLETKVDIKRTEDDVRIMRKIMKELKV